MVTQPLGEGWGRAGVRRQEEIGLFWANGEVKWFLFKKLGQNRCNNSIDVYPKAILYEINKELDCFCSILQGGVIYDVSHCSLEYAPCRVWAIVRGLARCGACVGFRDGQGRWHHWRKCRRKCAASKWNGGHGLVRGCKGVCVRRNRALCRLWHNPRFRVLGHLLL